MINTKAYNLASFTVFVGLVGGIFLLGVLGQWVNPILEYQRENVEHGQVWRLLSAHFVHLGIYHALLNLVGLIFWYALFARYYRLGFWLGLVFGFALTTGLMLHLFAPYLVAYAGYSGALHGLILFSLILDSPRDRLNLVFAAAFIGKVIYEQMPAYDVNYLRGYMDAPVIVDAHLFGTIVGVATSIAILACRWWGKRTATPPD